MTAPRMTPAEYGRECARKLPPLELTPEQRDRARILVAPLRENLRRIREARAGEARRAS